MKKYAIIVAAGKGERMNSPVPKQFLLLDQKPILWYTLHAFFQAYEDIHILLVLGKDYMFEGKNIAEHFFPQKTIQLIQGGATRFDSVQNALETITDKSIIFVHDGVRCLVTPHLIKQCYQQALEKGSAIPTVLATDSIRWGEGDNSKVLTREHVHLVQTPQTFHSELLQRAYRQPFSSLFTDYATLVEALSEKIYLIQGDYQNIKITRPQDLIIANEIIKERNNS